MPSSKRPKSPRVGDRARNKLTRRAGRIEGVREVHGHREYVLSYDEAPQDHFLTTPAKDGAQLPTELLEPET
jgi:hypothetical protein